MSYCKCLKIELARRLPCSLSITKMRIHCFARKQPAAPRSAFTLVEVMIIMALLLVLMISSSVSMLVLDRSSRRLADYTSAMALVEAKIYDIRAATYNPPSTSFSTNNVFLTNSVSIALDQAGQTFRIPGTIISKTEPVAAGHLVTVTGTFQTPGRPFSVSLQTVVNEYSGGQQ